MQVCPIWGAFPPDRIWNADHVPAPFAVNMRKSLNMKVSGCHMHAPRALFLPHSCPARLVSATCMPRAPCFCHIHAPRALFLPHSCPARLVSSTCMPRVCFLEKWICS
jgi:hypothetical protein